MRIRIYFKHRTPTTNKLKGWSTVVDVKSVREAVDIVKKGYKHLEEISAIYRTDGERTCIQSDPILIK